MSKSNPSSRQPSGEGPTDQANLSVVRKIPLTPIITLEGEAYEIPVEGSLGLLVMGYEGIRLWREKRMDEGDTYHSSHK